MVTSDNKDQGVIGIIMLEKSRLTIKAHYVTYLAKVNGHGCKFVLSF